MNRELKFRIFMGGQMHYNIGLHPFIMINHALLDPESPMYVPEGEEGSVTVFSAKDEIMQYTGITDKDGKEIYEGDILTWTGGKNTKRSGTVKWNTNRCAFQIDFITDNKKYFKHLEPDHFDGTNSIASWTYVTSNIYELQ